MNSLEIIAFLVSLKTIIYMYPFLNENLFTEMLEQGV